MKLHTVRAGGAILSFGILVGCTGQIGDGTYAGTGSTSGNTASGGVTGGGSGSSTGSGSGSTTGNGSGGNRPSTGTGGGTAPSGSGGGSTPAGSGGGSGTAIAPGDPGSLQLDDAPKYYRVLRLTNEQWAAAVQTVLNIPSGGLEQNFEGEVTGASDFSNNELWLGFDSRNWQDFQSAAEALAAQATASSSALSKVYSGTDAAGLITTVGRRAYRRPLTTTEQQAYMNLYTTGAAQASGTSTAFMKGAYLVISGMLQSANFLFRTELGAQGAPLSSYEMAAKLSLWLRGTNPDDKTLDMAAGTGKLDTPDGAAALAQTMMGEAATVKNMRDFHNQWLHIDDYTQVTKVDVAGFTSTLPAEFQESSYRFFDNIFSQGLGIKDVLTSTSGFYGPGMAKLYGVTAPAAGSYMQGDLGAKRVGFFSQVPYLTMNGLNDEPNPILRGVSLVRDVLCATLGPPAANIPPIPALMPGQTDRQRIDTLTGSCGSVCHNNMINPLGFAFEHFDGLGQWQDTENGGLTIDASGSYKFADGTTKTWTDAAGMMQALATTSQAHTCFAKKLAGFGLQRNITTSDMPLLNSLTAASMASGTNSEKQLILQLVRSDAFRTHGGPQ